MRAGDEVARDFVDVVKFGEQCFKRESLVENFCVG